MQSESKKSSFPILSQKHHLSLPFAIDVCKKYDCYDL